MSRFLKAVALGVVASGPALAQDSAEPLGIGREALPEEIAAWDVKIMPDGRGLPEGSGDVATGEEKYLEHCAACHGDFAEGLGNWPKLAGGEDTLARKDPVKTVGSYWPHLSTVWDYVHRSMPFGQAQILTPDETYAITAYILYSNYLVEDDFVLSKDNFLEVTMPNSDGFIEDDRAETEYPKFSAEPCMENCKDKVEITMHASVLDVTPNDPDDGDGTAEESVQENSEDPPEGADGSAAQPATAEVLEEPAEGSAPAEESAPAEAAPADASGTAEDDQAAAAPVDSESAPAETETASAEPDPALVAAGEKVFGKCKACHMVGEDAKNRVGPVLNGVVGRQAGAVEDFKYSPAMAESGLTWDEETLHSFLADPKGTIPKNKMAFAGLKKTEDLDAIVAYLKAHP